MLSIQSEQDDFYYQVDTGDIKHFIREYTLEELDSFINVLLVHYKRWADLRHNWDEARNLSVKTLDFPFKDYRQGQRKMAAMVYRTVSGCGKLFCQARQG